VTADLSQCVLSPSDAVKVRAAGDAGRQQAVGESTSGKSSDHQAWKSSALGMVLGDGTEVRRGNTYEQVESGRGQGK
jgi:hypothetical protein